MRDKTSNNIFDALQHTLSYNMFAVGLKLW